MKNLTVNVKMPEKDEHVDVKAFTTQAFKWDEGLKDVETILQHFEKHDSSVMDLMFLRRIRE